MKSVTSALPGVPAGGRIICPETSPPADPAARTWSARRRASSRAGATLVSWEHAGEAGNPAASVLGADTPVASGVARRAFVFTPK